MYLKTTNSVLLLAIFKLAHCTANAVDSNMGNILVTFVETNPDISSRCIIGY